MNILIIDDDVFQQKTLSFILTGQGHQVHLAANGQEAIERIEADRDIDAIVCDLMMPVLTGPSLILMLKRYFPTKRPAILVVSGVRDAEEFLRKIEIPYDYFFRKPVDREAFSRVVAEIAIATH